ncbi:MAG: hypothetical protein F4Y69_05080 [Chloroflexi bacterium]|nr:hypothetical protein [Chloroflexota bacterium]MYF21792.1 hypothetical protein [Chloroflexota bacterium]
MVTKTAAKETSGEEVARIAARALSEADLNHILGQLGGGRATTRGALSRFSALHERIRNREMHLYNSRRVDPRFTAPYLKAEPWQTDLLRRTWSQLRQRLTEHPLRVHVEPPDDSPAARQAADNLEHVLEQGLRHVEDRTHLSLQADLGYGQVCLCFGVLHWQQAQHRMPVFPAREQRGSRPDDGEERRRFRRARSEDGPSLPWIETEESRRDRDRRRQAAAGFPWDIEVIRPDQFAFVEDHGSGNGIGLAVVLREVGLFEYRTRLRDQDRLDLQMSAVSGDATLRIARAADAPLPEEPSGAGWGERLRIASVWTREEYYELVALERPASSPAGSGEQERHEWTLIKSHPHPYEMPPFAIAEADINDHPDMVHRWEPTMEGLYRVKPGYDFERSLGRFLAEQTASPLYWVQLADGSWQTDSDGSRIELTPDGAAAVTLPAGASLHRVEVRVDPAFVEFLRMSHEELLNAAPDAGTVDRGEIGPNTQPHTLNLLLGSRNLQVQQLKRAQSRAVRTMLRNMALVMSKPLSAGGFGAPIWVFARGKNGRVQRRETVCVEPSQIPSLDIDVWIDPYSAAQRIAVQEHGRARLNDPLDPLDQRAYLEEYIGEEHAEQVLARHRQWRAEQARLERDLAQARGVDLPESPSASGPPDDVPASGRFRGQLTPLGKLVSADDDRTASP